MSGRALTAFATLLLAACLTGCAGGHKITEGEPCEECHVEERPEFADVVPDEAVHCGLTFSVDAKAQTVYLCRARFGGKAGEQLVPTRLRTLSPDEAVSVTVPEPGVYLLCTGNPDAPAITPIVAEESGPADVVVEL